MGNVALRLGSSATWIGRLPGWLVAVALSLGGAAVVALSFFDRLVPVPFSDRGVFVSVAERLLAGDRLYAGAYDNKDPLFYYLLAAERSAGPITEFLVEFLLVLGTGLATALLAKSYRPTGKLRFLAITVLGMYLATGRNYWPGDTFLPGVFLAMVAIWLASVGRRLLGGVFVGLLLFTKLTLTPLAVIAIFVPLVVGDRPRAAALLRVGIGSAISAAGVVAVLGARGELAPYLAMQLSNVVYSQANVLPAKGLLGNLATHLEVAWDFGWPIIVGSGLASAALIPLALDRGSPARERRSALAAIAVFIASVASLSMLMIWPQHTGYLCLFELLAASVFAGQIRDGRAALAGLGLACLVLGGLPVEHRHALFVNPRHFGDSVAALYGTGPEAAPLASVLGPRRASYARLGDGNDDGHARGTRRYALLCPEFHQYPFYSAERLSRIIACSVRADAVIVHFRRGPYARPDDAWIAPEADFAAMNRRWDDYRRAVDRVLANGFSCRRFPSDVFICVRKNAADARLDQSTEPGERPAFPGGGGAGR